MASLTALAAPATVIVGSGPFKITPTISNPDRVITWTGTDETGHSVSGTTDIHENLTLSTDPAHIVGGKALPGFIVLQASASDSSSVPVSVDPDGLEWGSQA